LPPVREGDLRAARAQGRRSGGDVTLVGCGYSAYLCEQAAEQLAAHGIECDVIDPRVINPLDEEAIIRSCERTRALCVVDGSWRNSGFAAEIVALVAERLGPSALRHAPVRITLPDAPAPTSKPLEKLYYPTVDTVVEKVGGMLNGKVRK
jgi:pyruvate dehydrogenase E1 component beta subunit